MGGWVGGWVGGVCYCSIRLSQPSLAGVKAGAELGNNKTTPSVVQTGEILKFVQRNKKEENNTSRIADVLLDRGKNPAPVP